MCLLRSLVTGFHWRESLCFHHYIHLLFKPVFSTDQLSGCPKTDVNTKCKQARAQIVHLQSQSVVSYLFSLILAIHHTNALTIKIHGHSDISVSFENIVSGNIMSYLAIGRLFLVNSMRRIWKGKEHTANTLTTLKSENLTCRWDNPIYASFRSCTKLFAVAINQFRHLESNLLQAAGQPSST